MQGLNHFSSDIRYLSLLQVEKCLNSTAQTIDQVVCLYLNLLSD